MLRNRNNDHRRQEIPVHLVVPCQDHVAGVQVFFPSIKDKIQFRVDILNHRGTFD